MKESLVRSTVNEYCQNTPGGERYFVTIIFSSSTDAWNQSKCIKLWKSICYLVLLITSLFFSLKGHAISSYFGISAVLDGVYYKTGLGRSKKESKQSAAKLALDELLKLECVVAPASGKPSKYSSSTRTELGKTCLEIFCLKSLCSFVKCFGVTTSVSFESFWQLFVV